jgi:hypothetical protein
MATVDETVAAIVSAPTWDQRVAQIRLVAQRHGTADHASVFAAVAKLAYVPHLAPDYAYIHEAPFYESAYFRECYEAAREATSGFTNVSEETLTEAIVTNPRILLPLRTTLGLTKEEFAHSTVVLADLAGVKALTGGKVDSMERSGAATTAVQARLAARTIIAIMDGSLFGAPGAGLKSKQNKIDTVDGWTSVEALARDGVPFADFLHQRHYGGAFRQVLDATSTLRGNIIEDAVEAMFLENRIPHIRTGAHNQREIADRFEITVAPAPDFVVFDSSGTLRALLECKGANDGGTARDKALRFARLHEESVRLGGVPLMAVLGGLGWRRVNDTLGPVVRDTDGRVFTLATLPEMLTVAPFPSLIGTA